MKKSHFLIAILIGFSIFLSFAGCAGKQGSPRGTTTMEDDYKSDRDISREMDRDRLDRGGY